MTHEQLRTAIAQSSAFDWHRSDLGAEPDAHRWRAAYKPDLAIALAWGLKADGEAAFNRSGGFPDTRTATSFVDVLYHGALVERQLRVYVDGRCHLPVPTAKFNGHKVTGYTITAWEFALVGLLHTIESADADYHGYVEQCGIAII